MPHHLFRRHYTRDEARALLPQIRGWLQELTGLRDRLQTEAQRVSPLLAQGQDLGGPDVNRGMRCLAEIQSLLKQFQSREIQIKDLDRGLIDFPALRDDKEVFLCWKLDEEDIDFWHDLTSGYAGREKL